MTQEEKSLLIKDLCARLPYGVLLSVKGIKKDIKLFAVEDTGINGFQFKIVKPYLRKLSSMTEEEKKERLSTFFTVVDTKTGLTPMLSGLKSIEYIDWLIAHHFDYRGLIEKGLALEAPEGMYTNN